MAVVMPSSRHLNLAARVNASLRQVFEGNLTVSVHVAPFILVDEPGCEIVCHVTSAGKMFDTMIIRYVSDAASEHYCALMVGAIQADALAQWCRVVDQLPMCS
jgi:hypothetical protein